MSVDAKSDPYSNSEEISKRRPQRRSSSIYKDPFMDRSPSPPPDEDQGHISDGRPAPSLWQPILLRWVCIILHLFLILIHIALFVVWSQQWEYKIVISLFNSSTVSSGIVAIVQVFTTVYSVVLLALTQSFGLQRVLRRYQLLTATHDESSAWSGLGAALTALWNQRALKANVWGTLCVAVYLGCLSGIHVTMPSIISLSPFVNPGEAVVTTTLGMPNVTLKSTGLSDGDYLMSPFRFWYDVTAMLPFMGRTQEPLLLGLQNGTLYDILDDNTGIYNVTVNATTFNVTCGYLSNVTAIGKTPTNTTQWTVSSVYDGYNLSFDIPVIIPNTFQSVPDIVGQTRLLGRNNVFYASINITDSSGSAGSVVTLDPPMAQFIPSDPDEVAAQTVFAIQVMGCTLSLIHQEAIVDAQTKNLISVDSPTRKTSAEWNPWLPHVADATPWYNIADPQVDAWSEAFNEVLEGLTPTTLFCNQVSSSDCARINLIDEYIMGELGMYPGASLPNVTLADLENAFSSLTAALYWAGGHVGPSEFGSNIPTSPLGQLETLRGQTTASVTAARLNLNLVPLAAGLVASIVLCAFAIIVIGGPSVTSPDGIDSIGILQLVWLLHTQPSIQQRIGKVDEPSMENLRKAGMFKAQVQGSDIVSASGLESLAARNGSYRLVSRGAVKRQNDPDSESVKTLI